MVKKGVKRAGGIGKQVKCNKDDNGSKNKYYTEKGKKRIKKKFKNKVEVEVLKSSKSFVVERCSNLSNKKRKLKRKIIFQSSKDKDDITEQVETNKLLLDKPLKSSMQGNRRRKQRKKQQQLEAEEEEEEDFNYTIPVKQGDRINVNKLLFTKHRNFLLKSNSKQLVRPQDLKGKTIVLFFANLSQNMWIWDSFSLIEVYNQIHHKFPFEVILVPFTTPLHRIEHRRVDPRLKFTSVFSSMPWTSIPYSDVTSCQHLLTTFGFNGHTRAGIPVIDPTGLVLDIYDHSLFIDFGASGYPFTRQRINLLISEEKAIRKYPSIWNLLASPERDYVISNNGDKVHIQSLEDKVVALHFFEEALSPYYHGLTAELITAYEQLAKTKNFEVVLIYVYDTANTIGCTNEDTFWNKFKTMPWLALPFKDPIVHKLKRICHYPQVLDNPAPDPRLVIVGPRGEFCEPYGADVFMNCGIPAYPFSRRNMVDLVSEKAKSVKPKKEIYYELYRRFNWYFWEEDSIYHSLGTASA